MRHLKYLLPLLALLAIACQKDPVPSYASKSITFNASIEQFNNPDDGQKIVLRNEQWIYWEMGDQISIGSDYSEGATVKGDLVNASPGTDFEEFNGVFIVGLPVGSSKFLGLHPYDENNTISSTPGSANFGTPVLHLRAEQPLRNDSTFSRSILPMVAWYGGNWDADDPTPFNLDFHNLSAIVRVQLFNATGANAVIDYIDFTSVNFTQTGTGEKNLSGPFKVHDYNTENPFLEETNSGSKTVTITCGDDGLAFPSNDLKSFYLVLPAFGGREVTINLRIEMDVVTQAGTHCKKTFTAPTRRTGVTYLNAMGITEWNATNGSASAGLVGNGTPTRPFKIYTVNDLVYLRDHYNGDRKLNGQDITPETYIKLMRSDLVLTSSNWTSSINNFEGHFTSVNHQSNPGIIDSCSNVPLFQSIGPDGVVEGLSLKSAVTFNLTSLAGLSSFCFRNEGTIRNCVLTTIPGASSKYNLSIFSPFAGICVTNTNTGTIEGCRFEGNVEVQSGKTFAGICLHNSGTIKGCQISSASVRFANNASTAAGICYENETGGMVKDCYFATSVTGSTVGWAGIVYENSGTVEHCYLSSTGHIYTSKNVGGIVATNKTGGTVDYCWLEGPLRGKTAGGIVDSLAAGTIINCFNQGSAILTLETASGVGGGIAGRMTGGTIANSYVYDIVMIKLNTGAIVGGIVGQATGGIVTNCYSLEDYHLFYGTTSGTTYNYCYLVDGTQSMSGTESGTVSSSTTDAYETMESILNTHKPVGGKSWTGADGNTTPPVLEAYTISSKK